MAGPLPILHVVCDIAYHPPRVTRTADQIADLIRARIERGLLLPGQRVSQREIAELFSTSTTPVREAFQVLVTQGFMRIDRNRGAVLERPGPAQIREIYAIRKALEALAVRQAIANLTSADCARLEELVEAMSAAPGSGERAALNREFHSELYGASGMPRLVGLISQLRAAVSYYIERAYQRQESAGEAVADHMAILAACRKGDGDAAAHLLIQHLEKTEAVALASAEELELAGAALYP